MIISMAVLLIVIVVVSEYYKNGMYKEYTYGAAKLIMVMMVIDFIIDLTLLRILN